MNAAEQLEQTGEQKALRAAIARILGARSVALSELGRARLAAYADIGTLTRWQLGRSLTASPDGTMKTVGALASFLGGLLSTIYSALKLDTQSPKQSEPQAS